VLRGELAGLADAVCDRDCSTGSADEDRGRGTKLRGSRNARTAMKKLLAALTIGIAVVGYSATSGGADTPPSPEKIAQVQAWMGELLLTVPGADTRADVFRALNNDARVVLLAAEEHNNKARNKAEGKASNNINDYRSVITHSPDRKLNKAINKALDALGDWYDGVSDESRFDKATDKPWNKVKGILASYGLPTDDWSVWSR
jgi:hypothetical protein